MQDTSSPLAVKRRRINDATYKLSKPFVSPMRSAQTNRTQLEEEKNVTSQATISSRLAQNLETVDSSSANATPSQETNGGSRKLSRTPARTQHALSTWSKKTDPTELAAQKALTALEIQIKTLRNEVDNLKHAKQVTTSSKDFELDTLSDKWRAASQQAAEELFGTAKERVCRMGGVAAWRETEKRKYERSSGIGDFAPEPEVDNDADCEFDSQGEELPEKEQEARKAEKKRARQEAFDAADVDEPVEAHGDEKLRVWQEPGDDDDTFTMDMMLRSLNIDLEVLGYDKISQRWRGS